MFTVDGVKMAVQLEDCFILISTEIDDFESVLITAALPGSMFWNHFFIKIDCFESVLITAALSVSEVLELLKNRLL